MGDGKDVAAFLNQTPSALDEWIKIENPKIKFQVAAEMYSLYKTLAPRGSIKKNIKILDEYFKTAVPYQEGNK
jgi:hypothetical protein